MEHTSWEAPPQAVHGRLRQIAKVFELYRLQLFRLCKMRHANHFLPDSAAGRALLKALLRCKLSADAAMEAARWLEPSELPALQRAAKRLRLHDLGTWSALPMTSGRTASYGCCGRVTCHGPRCSGVRESAAS